MIDVAIAERNGPILVDPVLLYSLPLGRSRSFRSICSKQNAQQFVDVYSVGRCDGK